jgi:hypothetical protein
MVLGFVILCVTVMGILIRLPDEEQCSRLDLARREYLALYRPHNRLGSPTKLCTLVAFSRT